jgi:Flavodoxin-like fold
MNAKRIALIQGHPDALTHHLCHALAASYATGARDAGHQVRWIPVAELEFPMLRSQKAWESGELPPGLQQAQADILWAEHLVPFFPLWLGDMPALVYRLYFRAHSIKSLERNILGFVGIAPVHETLIGMVNNFKHEEDIRWLDKLHQLGRRGE